MKSSTNNSTVSRKVSQDPINNWEQLNLKFKHLRHLGVGDIIETSQELRNCPIKWIVENVF